jgi:hypothetical protein
VARNLRVYPCVPNNMEKPEIQRTLCIRTNKTQRTKTMATPTLPRNLGVYTGVPNNIKYEVITLVEMHVL